jgi:hypothetical protein
MSRAAILVLLCLPTLAHAWPKSPVAPPDPEPEPELVPEPVPPAPPPPAIDPDMPTPDELAERFEALEQTTKQLQREQRGYEETKKVVEKMGPLGRSVAIAAFVDVGAFAVAGNGAGIRSDFLHQHYPGYRNSVSGQWVFMGDPFTTMINSLGDPAETADSREVENDAINSSGRPSVIVNTIGLAIGKAVRDDVWINALAQLLPRPGDDIVEISYARVTYKPSPKHDFYLDAGKIDSVLGVEYRAQDAHRRLTVTPSLICRYTCGRPIGIDARYIGTRTQASAAIINGDNFEERFSPDPELRANRLPTLAGHLEYKLPVGQALWVGASGAVGPQDGQSDLGTMQWHVGIDLNLIDLRGFDATAELVQGKQQGRTSGNLVADQMTGLDRAGCDVAECLDYKGAYVLVSRRFARWIPYARFDWREATHQRGADFVYEARSIRGTFGLHVDLNSHIRMKVEYNWNHELGVPRFPHDVVTSSIVVMTD